VTERKRGRPRRNRGEKDRRPFAENLRAELLPVAEFLAEWRTLQALPNQKGGLDRYQQALATVADKHGMSRRTLERRYSAVSRDSMLGPIVEAAVAGILGGSPIVLMVEQIPRA
jgi:hypothetical protein